MHARQNYTFLLVLFAALFSISIRADESATHVAAITEIKDLLNIIAPSYECTITNYSVTTIDSSDETSYLIKGESSGSRCDEAVHVLNYRGESRRWTFLFVNSDPMPKPPDSEKGNHTNQDLIHEIDPEDAI